MKKSANREQALADREKLFIEATRQQICKQGLLGVQMAAIARSCNFATGTLYHHFASKEDLLMAVCSELSTTRQLYFRRVHEWQGANNRDKMFGFAVAHALFAQHHPEHFRLEQYVMTEVIWQATSEHRRQQFLEAMQPVGRMVESLARQAIDDGDVEPYDIAPLALAVGQWTMSTGMHTLIHADGVLSLYDLNDPYRLLLQNIRLQLNALGWKPLAENPFDRKALEEDVTRLCKKKSFLISVRSKARWTWTAAALQGSHPDIDCLLKSVIKKVHCGIAGKRTRSDANLNPDSWLSTEISRRLLHPHAYAPRLQPARACTRIKPHPFANKHP
ncbi:AcrR family transcriptional regulator [Alcanivorax hongdengensis A-11-3]|uniref:AcrR family transcriptional regulator n=1 Tax=Alcanivorax hongdengensis A-11-3 TaxID=1177179 RepID=L0WDW5_9GAMM|nr:TetR/AcrR family transcriptional regulator [Alcanivorax hongdengensis]EKF74362.1 AcrR family transcriptional regulator [Alcanivorax hongdengensis A-11-3]